jgi:hypothetical protein
LPVSAMKPQQFARITAMLLVAGNCLFTGCARMEAGRHTQFTIKVVDEKNNQPVPGVSAVWREDLNDLILGHFQIGPTKLQPSNDAGMIKIVPVREGMVGCLTLTRPGGFKLYCGYAEGRLGYSGGMFPIASMPDEDYFGLENPIREAVRTNGYFIVPMPSE